MVEFSQKVLILPDYYRSATQDKR